MSALAGIWWWDGRPVPDSLLHTLDAQSQLAGPDGGGTIQPLQGLALQAHLLHFDRLSTQERQPHVFGGGAVLCWDGRLDNRDDLLLTLHHDLADGDTDACVVAAAYVRWGKDCLRRLVGDWSLAIWDAAERRLLLARDYCANRPLYYRVTPEGVAWATRLDALIAAFSLETAANEDFIVGQLTSGVPPGVTPYQTIRALRGGHVLLASAQGQVTVQRYWFFEPRTLRYRRLDDYDDQLRSLLSEAVQVRLRSNRPAWSHLSGGYDSSSLVCLAHALIAREHVDTPALRTASMVFSHDPEADESPYIEAIERWCGLQTTRIEFQATPSFDDLLESSHPLLSHAELTARSLEAPMRAAGDRIILSGEGGDALMMRGGFGRAGLLEPLFEGDLKRLAQLCWIRSRRKQIPLTRLFRSLAWEAFSTRVLDRTPRRSKPSPPPAAVLARPIECSLDVPSVREFPHLKHRLVRALYAFGDSDGFVSPDHTPGILRSFPFTHRPLVEYILAVPFLALWSADEDRAGMKRALRNVLPSEVLERNSKPHMVAALTRERRERMATVALSGLSGGPIEDWELVRRGYLHGAVLAEALRSLRAGVPLESRDFPDKWFHLEAWLRRLSSGGKRLPASESGRTTPYRPERWQPPRTGPVLTDSTLKISPIDL